jgi:hypothetical protein
LIGNVTVFQDWDNVPEEETIKDCYLAQHPDANRWLPNDEEAAHIVSFTSSSMSKLKVTERSSSYL